MGIIPGVYRHYKGNEYNVLGVGKHSETLEEMVVYQALYEPHEIWVRPIEMWNEEVDKPELGYKGPRFQFLRKVDNLSL